MRALVFVGASCNNRCVFCAQGDLRSGDEARASDAEVRARISSARPADALTLAGGEPTLHGELPAWARFARSEGFASVEVQTNGRRLSYRRYADALVRAGVDALDVSLHGHEARVHDWHTRVGGSFDQTTAGIANAVAAGAKVGVTVVITRSSHRHLADVVRLAARLGADAVHLSAALPRGEAEASFDSVVPRFALLAEPLAEALGVAERLGVSALVTGVPACVLGDRVGLRSALGVGVVHEHGRPCAACTWREACPGLPAEYLRRLGDGELTTRTDSPRAFAASTRFAGPGVLEPVRPQRLPSRPPPADVARASLRELGKPAPALHEIRLAKKKTGGELAEIFPALFEKP